MVEWATAIATAIGVVGSVSALGLTVYKIFSLRKNATSSEVADLRSTLTSLQTDNAVLKAEMADLKEDVKKVEEHCEKAQDLLLKLLTEER